MGLVLAVEVGYDEINVTVSDQIYIGFIYPLQLSEPLLRVAVHIA